jgi:glucose-6-phosphate isomerase
MAGRSPAWTKLESLYKEKYGNGLNMQHLFAIDPARVSKYTKHLQSVGHIAEATDPLTLDFYYDYSKNLVTDDIMDALVDLADESGLSEFIEQLFSGAPVNATEGRSVLHMALRAQHSSFYTEQTNYYDYEKQMPNVFADIQIELERMRCFSEAISSGQWRGYNGQKICDVVNIGIGGSDLGPRMVVRALEGVYTSENRRCHFVSNVDAMDLASVLVNCQPESTLFIIVSKTFTTQETMMNAASAKAWFLSHCGGDVH